MSKNDNLRSRNASMANERQKMMKAEHSANDAFVKKQQAEIAKMAGRAPNLSGESLKFNAYMCNNGEHAQEVARTITKGLDKKAFPVK